MRTLHNLVFLAFAFTTCTAIAQNQPSAIPDDYKVLYEQNFEQKNALQDFIMTDDKAWKVATQDGNQALNLHGASQYEPRVRSPRNIAMLKEKAFGSFVLEADVKQTGKEYGHRDMCFFFNIKDPGNFYYVHLATKPDPHAHNIFLVNDEPRVAIAKKVSEGVDWGSTDQWHKVRIVRNIEDGTIRVYFDNMDQPIMEASDTHFVDGYIGFGSFDDTGMIDNIKVWGPGYAKRKEAFFE